MKKNILTLSIGALLIFAMLSTSFSMPTEADTYVYVCGKSKIYHNSKYHSALGRCKSGVTKMTVSKAKSLEKKACKCRN